MKPDIHIDLRGALHQGVCGMDSKVEGDYFAEKATEYIQSLMERDTPKPVFENGMGMFSCTSCGHHFVIKKTKRKFCDQCGQRLDWIGK